MVTHKFVLPNFSLGSSLAKACASTAVVYVGRRRTTGKTTGCCGSSHGETFAIRMAPIDNNPKVTLEELQKEVCLMRSAKHKNVLAVCEIIFHESFMCIVTPLMDFGSVTDIIHANFTCGLPEAAVALIISDVLEALSYLHYNDIIHRSLRCSHILVSSSGNACVTGFRYAISVMKEGQRSQKIHDFSPALKPNLLWLAPEVLQQNMHGYHLKSDVYSLGVSLCEMANGFPPFADMEPMQMLLEKLRGTTPRLLDSTTLAPASTEAVCSRRTCDDQQRSRQFSESFHNFAELCLRPDPHVRPTAKELLSHNFLKNTRKPKSSLKELLQPLKPLAFPKAAQATDTDKQKGVDSGTQRTDIDVEWNFV